MAESRQLAAIMFTDLVGYSSMMRENEEKAFDVLQKNRNIQKPLIEQYRGRWLKEMGDGTLSSFPSSHDAVQCAKEIQKLAKSQDLNLRIGIHAGDVTFSNGDVFGDGVNVASRIEEIAEGGQILISEEVFNNIRNQAEFHMGYYQELALRKVKGKIRIYEVFTEEKGRGTRRLTLKRFWNKRIGRGRVMIGLAGLLALSAAGWFIVDSLQTRIPPIEDKSVAVMAFDDLSPGKDQGYLGDGIAEEILNALTQIEGLKVAGRMSSFSFKGKNADHKEVGTKLNVSTILEGSVQKIGNRIKITAQLIKADDGFHLWSDRFDRDDTDIFAVQEDIARHVADKLEITLLRDASKPLVTIKTANPKAYELYLKGRHFFNQRVEAERAIHLFEQAIQLEPRFAEAHAAVAYAWSMLDFTRQRPPQEVYPKVKENALRALELNQNLAEAHFALGIYQGVYEWDFAAEAESYRKAIELNPYYPYAYLGLAITFIREDNREQAIETAKRSLSIDPMNLSCMFFLGDYLRASGYTEEAIDIFNQILLIDPDYSEAYRGLGNAYISKKEYDKGIELLQKSYRSPESKILVEGDLARAHYRAGQMEEVHQILQRWEKMQGETWIPAFYFGRSYYWLKQYENACIWMEKAFHDKEIAVVNFMQRSGKDSPSLKANPVCQSFLREYEERFPSGAE